MVTAVAYDPTADLVIYACMVIVLWVLSRTRWFR